MEQIAQEGHKAGAGRPPYGRPALSRAQFGLSAHQVTVTNLKGECHTLERSGGASDAQEERRKSVARPKGPVGRPPPSPPCRPTTSTNTPTL